MRGDQWAIYDICNDLLGRKKDLPLPPSTSKEQLANEFNEFFVDKIKTIHVNIEEIKENTTSMHISHHRNSKPILANRNFSRQTKESPC